ncbi:pyridoxamine 5'-phosphate oxidase family protein [uncultured Enterovirga sp.]|uniref:pyridoxamine 5'-phosphate oxidase family protein n=1 Tax=uncultured Enterovirga sp. TaxID=2026352 RepID=UPI0035C9A690
MASITLKDLAETMRDIDFAMLSTRTENGAVASRPMSNNRDVDFSGDCFFFSYDSARTIADIGRDPQVGLTFTGRSGFLGGPPVFIAVAGTAELIRDKNAFRAHWTKDLDRWFADGVDTPGLVLIRVHADRVHAWNGADQTEIEL